MGQSIVIGGSILVHNVLSVGKGVNVEGSFFSLWFLSVFLGGENE